MSEPSTGIEPITSQTLGRSYENSLMESKVTGVLQTARISIVKVILSRAIN